MWNRSVSKIARKRNSLYAALLPGKDRMNGMCRSQALATVARAHLCQFLHFHVCCFVSENDLLRVRLSGNRCRPAQSSPEVPPSYGKTCNIHRRIQGAVGPSPSDPRRPLMCYFSFLPLPECEYRCPRDKIWRSPERCCLSKVAPPPVGNPGFAYDRIIPYVAS